MRHSRMPYDEGRRRLILGSHTRFNGLHCFTQTTESNFAPPQRVEKAKDRSDQDVDHLRRALKLAPRRKNRPYQDSSIARRDGTPLSPYLSCLVAGLLLEVLPSSVDNVYILPLASLD